MPLPVINTSMERVPQFTQVLTSDAWAKAVDQGRWPAKVRPFTKNRRDVLYRRLLT